MGETYTAIIILLEVCICVDILYLIYKVIWYLFKMLSLFSKLKKFKDSISFQNGIFKIMFDSKRTIDFTIDKRDIIYEVRLLSFISTHGRWNIEKDRNGCYAEARRKSFIFYKNSKHSEAPVYAHEFRRESRFQRVELPLIERNDAHIKQILLIYPKPKNLTYTHTRLEYLQSRDVVEGYEIMYLDDLLKLI